MITRRLPSRRQRAARVSAYKSTFCAAQRTRAPLLRGVGRAIPARSQRVAGSSVGVCGVWAGAGWVLPSCSTREKPPRYEHPHRRPARQVAGGGAPPPPGSMRTAPALFGYRPSHPSHHAHTHVASGLGNGGGEAASLAAARGSGIYR